MSLYAVTLHSPKLGITEAFTRAYGDHFAVHPQLMIIRAPGPAKAIIDGLGLPDEDRSGIFIVQISADYFGFASKPFWDWLAASFRAESNG